MLDNKPIHAVDAAKKTNEVLIKNSKVPDNIWDSVWYSIHRNIKLGFYETVVTLTLNDVSYSQLKTLINELNRLAYKTDNISEDGSYRYITISWTYPLNDKHTK